MAFSQTKNLEKIVDDSISPNLISRWIAAHNPVYIEFQRHDDLISSFALINMDTEADIVINNNASFNIGDEVMLIYAPYKIVGVVLSKTGFDQMVITISKLTFSLDYYNGFTDFINNLTIRKYYAMDFKIISEDNLTEFAFLTATPNSNGVTGIDLSGSLQSLLKNPNTLSFDTNFTNVFHYDVDCDLPFRYAYRERWLNLIGNWNVSELHHAINGEFQIGHEFNGNYAEYLPNDNLANSKWLVDFEEITAWTGKYLTIAFLIGQNVGSYPFIKQSFFDSQGNYIDANYYLGSVTPERMIRLLIPVDSMISGTKVKYFTLKMFNDMFEENPIPLSSELKFNVVDSEPFCDGIYLEWLGEKGNRSYFLFNNLFTENLQIDGGTTFQKPFNSIDDLEEISDWYKKDAFKKITLGAENLTKDQITGLKSLLKSTKVYQILDSDFNKKIGVLVEPSSFTIGRGNDDLFRIEFSIVYPKQFNQTA